MSTPSIRPQKGSELVMELLRGRIASGEYPPGSQLPTVVRLAAELEVGRSTVREALSALKAMGYIDIRHGGGTFVRREQPTEQRFAEGLIRRADSLREVLEVRRYIEAGCAALAAERRTDADVKRLAEIIAEMERALGDERASEQADAAFHLAIADASRNGLLIGMMASLTQRLQDSMQETRRLWFFSEQATAEQLLAEHRDIYAAIRDRDSALASERIVRHISKVDHILHRMLER